MKKILSYILCAIMAMGLVAAAITPQTVRAAEGSITISASSSDVIVGETVTVTVTLSCPQKIIAALFNLTYDGSVLETSAGSSGVVSLNFMETSYPDSYSWTVDFTAVQTGKCTFGIDYSTNAFIAGDGTDIPDSFEPAVNSTTVNIWAKGSDDASLSALSVAGYDLSPAFSSATHDYTVWVGTNVTSVSLSATSTQGGRVELNRENPMSLSVGNNYVTFTVYAPKGNTSTYTINVYRTEPPTTTAPTTTEAPTTTAAPTLIEVERNNRIYYLSDGFFDSEIPESFERAELTYGSDTIEGLHSEELNLDLYYLIPAEPEEEEATEAENSGVETTAGETAEETTTAAKTQSTTSGSASEADEEDTLWGTGHFYLYNEAKDAFYLYSVVTIREVTYVLADPEWSDSVPADTVEKNVTVDEKTFTGYVSTEDTDFVCFYAWNNKDAYQWYVLDTLELTVQRMSNLGASTVEVSGEVDKSELESLQAAVSALEAEKEALNNTVSAVKAFRNVIVVAAAVLIFILLVLVIYLFIRENGRVKKEQELIRLFEEREEEEAQEEFDGVEELDFSDAEAGEAEDVDGTDGTDGAEVVDETAGTAEAEDADGTDGTDGVEGVDEAVGTDATDEVTVTESVIEIVEDTNGVTDGTIEGLQ